MRKFHWAIPSGLVALVIAALVTTGSHAAVTVIGDVTPADNIATPAIEGIPSAGNGWNALEPNNAQSRWETNQEIIVGRYLLMGGRMDIDGNTNLRYTDLIIGDRNPSNPSQVGTGTVLITGVGALYSNDPTSLPPNLPPDYAATGAAARPADVGYDLIVGRYGQGTFELRNGGRAEIQDAVVVGDQPGSSGVMVIDGFGSLLGSGGFDSGSTIGGNDPHQLIVGRRGLGFMTIRNQGTVVTEAVQSIGSGGSDILVAAVIGSDALDGTQVPDPGGDGTVIVTGTGSKWIVGGSLQVGGFHNSTQGALADPSGVNAIYNSDAGVGKLYVQDNAFVNIRGAANSNPDSDELALAIGRFGRVELAGGVINIGGSSSTGGSEGQGRQDTMKVLNDGVISGTGRISTGVFHNRYVGEVRVNAGQSLLIEATSEFSTTGTAQAEPLANWGVIRTLGTSDQRAHLEFDRAPNTLQDPVRPFQNLRAERPATAAPTDFYGGLISAQYSNLIFRSGIENQGMVAFTAGDNYVVGNVWNLGADPATPDDYGIIYVNGPTTRVIFENDLISGLGSDLSITGGATVRVLQRHSLVAAGKLTLEVNPSNPAPLATAGDLGLYADLRINLVNIPSGSLGLGDTFEIMSFGGDLGGVNLADPQRPTVDLDVGPTIRSLSFSPSLASLGLAPGLVLVPEYTLNSVLLAVRSTIGHIGPDFNGDGVVDHLDLAIWQTFKGMTSGATVLQGDANGDGAVNGLDYMLWLQAFTGSPGAGGGAGSGSGTVPEPAGLVLLAIGGLTASAIRRRR